MKVVLVENVGNVGSGGSGGCVVGYEVASRGPAQ